MNQYNLVIAIHRILSDLRTTPITKRQELILDSIEANLAQLNYDFGSQYQPMIQEE